uniref:Uncharacterized protein n=1 Tax=Anguilla anguilla TaxID=7936 RepID=A0A0E9VZM4_ANGAN
MDLIFCSICSSKAAQLQKKDREWLCNDHREGVAQKGVDL